MVVSSIVLMLICQRGMYLEQCEMRAYDTTEICEQERLKVRAYHVRCLPTHSFVYIPKELVK